MNFCRVVFFLHRKLFINKSLFHDKITLIIVIKHKYINNSTTMIDILFSYYLYDNCM